MTAIFDQQDLLPTENEVVSAHGDSPGAVEVNVHPLIADMVSRNAPETDFRRILPISAKTNIRTAGTVASLNRIASDRAFTNAPTSTNIDQHVVRFLRFKIVVVFNIITGDLSIPDRSTANDDASAFVITDVAAANNRLMEVNVIEKSPDSTAIVNMTRIDNYVSISFAQPNPDPNIAYQYTRHDRLHRTDQVNPKLRRS